MKNTDQYIIIALCLERNKCIICLRNKIWNFSQNINGIIKYHLSLWHLGSLQSDIQEPDGFKIIFSKCTLLQKKCAFIWKYENTTISLFCSVIKMKQKQKQDKTKTKKGFNVTVNCFVQSFARWGLENPCKMKTFELIAIVSLLLVFVTIGCCSIKW